MKVGDNVSGGGPARAAAAYIQPPETVAERLPQESVSKQPVPEAPDVSGLALSSKTVRRSEQTLPPESADTAEQPRCRRCFLYEMDGHETYYQNVVRLRRAMPEAEKADDAEYGRRLSVCRECPYLDNATCMQCGCYAEVRALKRTARCPMKRW